MPDAGTLENPLFLTLGEVSELVSHSHDLPETLANIVALLQQHFHSEVCSIYLGDAKTRELTLAATRGLNPECVGTLKLSLDRGLVGRTARLRAPVNLSDAAADPEYVFFPDSGEEQYASFLGVPLIASGQVQGVLVVQHRASRRYSNDQLRFASGVGAQVATLVANARLAQQLNARLAEAAPPELAGRPAEFHGVAASPGAGSGRALRFEAFDFDAPALVARPAGTVAAERAKLHAALDAARADLDNAAVRLSKLLGEEFAALMQAQRLMLEDHHAQKSLQRRMDEGASAERAVVETCQEYLKAFEGLDNPFFYERMFDIKDVFRRVLQCLAPAPGRAESGADVVVVAEEVSLLELFSCDLARVRGIAVERGGGFSHVAILARSLGIPMVTQLRRLVRSTRDGDRVFVDASSGTVAVNPEPARAALLARVLAAAPAPVAAIAAAPLPLRVLATVNLLPEAARAADRGAEGIGLFRSEFLQLPRRSFPSEEEQFDAYCRLLDLLAGRPVTVRTFDLRAEKMFAARPDDAADAVWDWRLVADAPHVQEAVRTQLRALLRAADRGPLQILFPMIATERQFQQALKLVEEAARSLRAEGVPHRADAPRGLMVEVPAAVLLAPRWAKQVDFLSIGSNDLLHSLLGVERNDDTLAALKTPFDPAYLRAVHHVVKHAAALGKPVTVCGEAASQPKAAVALAALGVSALSVPPDDIARVRAEFASRAVPGDLAPCGRALARALDPADALRLLDEHCPPHAR